MPSAALERHPAVECAALRAIEARVARTRDARLDVGYFFEGAIERLRIPEPQPPRVRDGLWQHTCCEIFIARDGAAGYQEFNFSPSGEWAAYAFAHYREGSPLTVPDPRISVRRSARRFTLRATIPAPPGKLRIGLAVVVEADSISYWALRHARGKPDFHHASSFALELDEVRD